MSEQNQSALRELAERAGIIAEYVDQTGKETRRTSDETRVRLLRVLGIDASSEEATREALRELDEADRRPLQPVRVISTRDLPSLTISLPPGQKGASKWELEIVREDGRVLTDSGNVASGATCDIAIGKMDLSEGYHKVRLRVGGGAGDHDVDQSLIIVPPHCPPARDVAGERGVFGVTANLYTVRSRRNWGIGDVGDLATMLEWAGERGAAFVGVNPLHALRNRGPDISPYSPVSRVYRNVAYIDVEGVAELSSSHEAQSLMGSAHVSTEVARLRATNAVEYDRVMALKRPVLEALHRTFRSQVASKEFDRGARYRRYVEEQGVALAQFATFMALQEHFERVDGCAEWQKWPAAYQDAASPEVRRFRQENQDAIDLHLYLQFVLDEQLAQAAERGKDAGLGIGLYQDLAIGTSPHGSDTWLMRQLFVQGASIGAPPDEYSKEGQNWGLPPLHPHRLRDSRYEYWIDLVRASLRHSGALRIDHVMGLFRQFWVPDECTGKDGAYVRFPSDDLLGILALEATRSGALVVGEDLGTVPPDVPPALERWQVLSSRVLYFEREKDGGFKASSTYDYRSLATANTHDMATLAGYWSGRDIELREEVGLIEGDDERRSAVDQRRDELRKLVARLRHEGLLPSSEGEPAEADVRRAVHEFLCASPAALVGLSLDDLVGETEPVNVPGVGGDKFASWTRRLTPLLEDIIMDPAVRRAMGCSSRGAR